MPKNNPSNVNLAQEVVEKLGLPSAKPVKVKMLHAKVVREFIQKVSRAHEAAGKSKLHFP